MKVKKFANYKSERKNMEAELNAFMAGGIEVRKVVPVAFAEGWCELWVFYDDEEEAVKDLALFKEQTIRCAAYAADAEKNGEYAALLNNTQRKMFLAANFGVTAQDAELTIELLKPEMRATRNRLLMTVGRHDKPTPDVVP